MDLGDLRKLTQADAAAVLAGFEAGEGAQALVSRTPSVRGFLGALIEHRLWSDAVRTLAFALPPREGVWWACVAARGSLPPNAPPPVVACLEAAEAWVYRPSDEGRRAVFPLAEALGFDSPPAYAALAAFWSGGSLAPVGVADVLPSPSLCPTAVAAAVLLAAVIKDPAQAETRYRALMASGLHIAGGGNGLAGPAL